MSEVGRLLQVALQVGVDQQTKGINKYGVSLEDATVTVDEIIRHAQEEVADASVYLAKMLEVIERDRQETRAQAFDEMLTFIRYFKSEVKRDFIVEALERFVTERSAPRTIQPLYAQASVVQEFMQGANLLTLSRSNKFPFGVEVKVVL